VKVLRGLIRGCLCGRSSLSLRAIGGAVWSDAFGLMAVWSAVGGEGPADRVVGVWLKSLRGCELQTSCLDDMSAECVVWVPSGDRVARSGI
jgi:hypothetical protein